MPNLTLCVDGMRYVLHNIAAERPSIVFPRRAWEQGGGR